MFWYLQGDTYNCSHDNLFCEETVTCMEAVSSVQQSSFSRWESL